MYYYLLPNVAYGAVQQLCREQGQEFPVSLKALYKHLRTDGILDGGTDNPTKTKRVAVAGGTTVMRLMWLPRSAFNGPETTEKQLRWPTMEGEELPPEWT